MCFQNLGPKHVASTPSTSTSSRCTWIMTMNMVVTTSQWKKYSSATWLFLWLAGSLDKVCLEGHVELQWNSKQCVFQQVYLQLHLHLLKIPFLYTHYTLHTHHNPYASHTHTISIPIHITYTPHTYHIHMHTHTHHIHHRHTHFTSKTNHAVYSLD